MAGNTAVARNAALLEAIFGDRFLRGFDIRFWDGTRLADRDAHPAFTLVLNEPSALRRAFSPPIDLNAGRAMVDGRIEIEGNLERAIASFNAAANTTRSLGATLRIAALLARLPRGTSSRNHGAAMLSGRMHSRDRDRAAIAHHYDHPVAFFQTFLDRAMVYSCAYYPDPSMDLDAAQQAKLGYILGKLRVRPGMTLLDIGCGWGSLVIKAARAGLDACGITLSRVQFEEANRRIAEAGLSERARVEFRDYRDLNGTTFDRIASVGMVEHVGRKNLPAYFRAAYAALRPGGLFLNHGIAEQSAGRRGGKAHGFVARYVFPDGELVSIGDSLAIAERCGFEVRDVENLREHYAATLRAWVANIERHRDAAVALAGENAYRTWRLYMAGSSANFTAGNIGLFQALLGRPKGDGVLDIPPTRADLYP